MDATRKMQLAEAVEAANVESLLGLMDAGLRDSLGVTVRRFGDGLAVRMTAEPDFPYLNRVFALGSRDAFSFEALDEALGFLRRDGSTFRLLQLPPDLEDDAVLQGLAERGFRRGGSWTKFLRSTDDPPSFPTDLEVVEVDASLADEAAAVQAESMGFPPFMVPWLRKQVGSPGWHCFAALDGDRVVGVGNLFVHGDVGQLSGAGTLPEARGRGAQLALMARRFQRAREAGASWVGSETGSESPDSPNPSLRNMRRAGMEELYERQNWLCEP